MVPNVKTLDSPSDPFLAVALRHKLLDQAQIDKLVQHAGRVQVPHADAALSLAILDPHEVDAIDLLSRPTELAPGFVLIGLIGCGTGGLVFRATQTALNRDVAIKTINVNSRSARTTGESRIQREAHAIAKLQHPNIVAAFDSGFYHGRFCIAMELVEGETLAEFIRHNGPIQEHVAWGIARQVAAALSHANRLGIIHRDIKPANLLLTDAPAGLETRAGVPFVKVVDFGLAFESESADSNLLTAPGTTLGTPAYVAPEQLHDTHVDARADIYSLGATVYHMLTGNAPCADLTPMKTILRKTIGDDSWRRELPKHVSASSTALMRLMTETKTEDRIGDYAELIRRIDELTGSEKIDQVAVPIAINLESAERVARPTTWRPYLTWTFVPLCVFSVVLVGLSGYEIWQNAADSSARIMETTWPASGVTLPLFNGETVPLFSQSGSWTPSDAEDGSRVLQGQAGSRITIPVAIPNNETASARLRLGVNLPTTSTLEIAIQWNKEHPPQATLTLASDLVRFVPDPVQDVASAEASISYGSPSDDTVVFQRLAFYRQAHVVIAEVNGQRIGHVIGNPGQTPEIIIRCLQGDSRLADIDIVELQSPN